MVALPVGGDQPGVGGMGGATGAERSAADRGSQASQPSPPAPPLQPEIAPDDLAVPVARPVPAVRQGRHRGQAPPTQLIPGRRHPHGPARRPVIHLHHELPWVSQEPHSDTRPRRQRRRRPDRIRQQLTQRKLRIRGNSAQTPLAQNMPRMPPRPRHGIRRRLALQRAHALPPEGSTGTRPPRAARAGLASSQGATVYSAGTAAHGMPAFASA